MFKIDIDLKEAKILNGKLPVSEKIKNFIGKREILYLVQQGNLAIVLCDSVKKILARQNPFDVILRRPHNPLFSNLFGPYTVRDDGTIPLPGYVLKPGLTKYEPNT